MTLRHRGQEPRLVRHQVEVLGQQEGTRVGQLHARRRARRGLLERVQQRTDQLPAGQPAQHPRCGLAEVGDQERVGQLCREHGLRQHLALGTYAGRGRCARRLGLRLGLEAGRGLHLTLQPTGAVGDLGVLGQEVEQRRLLGGRLGQDRGDAVEALEHGVALLVGQRVVGTNPRALGAGEQSDRLVARALPRGQLPARDRAFDLAHRLREHRDDALLVPPPGLGPGAGSLGRPAVTGTPASLCGQPAALFLMRVRHGHGHNPPPAARQPSADLMSAPRPVGTGTWCVRLVRARRALAPTRGAT